MPRRSGCCRYSTRPTTTHASPRSSHSQGHHRGADRIPGRLDGEFLGRVTPASSQHLGDKSWLGHVGEVAVACEDVDMCAWNCCGGPDVMCEVGGVSGSGEEQGGDGEAKAFSGLPVSALRRSPRTIVEDAGDALGPVWCRAPFRDLLFGEPGFGPMSIRTPSLSPAAIRSWIRSREPGVCRRPSSARRG